jgi:hypothetical protein
MYGQKIPRGPWKTIGIGGVLMALAVSPAWGQSGGWLPSPPGNYPPPCLPPATLQPPATTQAPAPMPPSPPAPQPPPEPLPSLSPESGLAFGGRTVAVAPGYIDPAAIRSQFRFRYDSAYNDNRPDRAAFLYPKCGCLGGPGPSLSETRIDFQELSGYLEWAVNDRFSGFLEVPVRFLNAEQNVDTSGLSDINAGFKAAIRNCPDQILTFQFRTYTPTGSGARGLGTDHVSLEPALLGYQQLTDRLALHGELRDWIPLGGTDFAGNVIRYGVGVSYDVVNNCHWRVTPITEFVGWTVLSGRESDARQNMVLDADGNSILNAKFGVRLGWGGNGDFYVGYGRALTGQVWYKDILRVEYRWAF